MTPLPINSHSRTLARLIKPALSRLPNRFRAQKRARKIRERGVLRVGTLNNPLSYYIGPDGPTGLDYELAREFAKELGVKLEMKPAYRLSSLFPALKTVKWTSLPQA